MELTININTQQPKVDAFLNFIKSLDFIEIINIKSNEDRKHLQQKKFKKKLFTALDELKDAREGKIKLGNLEDLLNEI
ncbi:hypothetical protein [Capnocytophaga leadbetteri]|jgi:hypothetical protein|uniref:hypothetical protein n=1 Tax=Capnocytophaga leadbetteri TaxID=327575 RepID=UPI0026EAFE66|nr:hypothetical protein [Capnocytophaga leadbetteri]